MAMSDKNFDWIVVVTCQGNPRYYKQRNLLCGIPWQNGSDQSDSGMGPVSPYREVGSRYFKYGGVC